MAVLFANNNSLSAITTQPSGLSGSAITLLSTQTASSSATISFTSGIDSTYKEYIFKFYDIHPATDSTDFSFQVNAAGGSGYNETITSSFFRSFHGDADGGATLAYYATLDQDQGTGFQALCENVGNDNDSQLSGILRLYDPSTTSFYKHFASRTVIHAESDFAVENYITGYINTTTAIDEIQFKMDSGNIDSGVIKLYGVS